MKKKPRDRPTKDTPASLLVQQRWAKTSAAQRREYALMMVRAKAAKAKARKAKAKNGPKE